MFTKLPIGDVRQRLLESTGIRENYGSMFNSQHPRKEFDGQIKGNKFELTRQITIVVTIRANEKISVGMFFGFMLFWILPYGMVMLGFKSESIMAKNFLSNLLEEEEN